MYNVFCFVTSNCSRLTRLQEFRYNILKIDCVENMAKFLVGMDLAFGSCGVNSMERCCMGVPSLMVETAENKARNYHNLLAKDLAIPVCNEKDIAHRLQTLHDNSQQLKLASELCCVAVDGKGRIGWLAELVRC